MVAIWIIIGLILASIGVSTLAAAFSVVGLGVLFSGATMAVWAMAGSLEFAKFVLAAYLHQTWNSSHKVFRTYLTFAIVTLSLITSMGVFGFLSDAYQSASHAIDTESTKLFALKNRQQLISAELARINKGIDEIPSSRITKKMNARKEAEPLIKELNAEYNTLEKQVNELNLKVLEVKKKVGPLVYIARAFNIDIDTAVKYLILAFVLVFDPLAICLVIATSHALESRKKFKLQKPDQQEAQKEQQPIATQNLQPLAEEELIQMRFIPEESSPESLAKNKVV